MVFKALCVMLGLGIVSCDCYFIQKCCEQNQQLALNFSSCITFNGTRSTVSQAEPVPPQNVTKFLFGRLHTCFEWERTMVTFYDQAFLLDNGALLMTDIFDNVKPKTMIFPYESFCLDRVTVLGDPAENNFTGSFNHSFVILLCPCSMLPCVRMRCPKNMHLNVDSRFEECQSSEVSTVSTSWASNCTDSADNVMKEKFEMVRGVPNCKSGYYYSNSSSGDLIQFNLLPNGNITIAEQTVDMGSRDYCVHYPRIEGKFDSNLQYCKITTKGRKNEKIDFQGVLYIAYFIVGAFFLAATLIIYSLVGELRKTMYASLLMNHVACLLVCYVVMALEKIVVPPLCTWICILVGHLVQFSFIAAIFWLNMMCVYISRNFRSLKTLKCSVRTQLKNRFQYWKYSAYVWGAALAITLTTFLVDYNMLLSEEMRPRFGFEVCWFAGYWTKFWYFYLPISTVLIANLILFAFTVKKILTMQNESKRILSRESKKHIGNKLVAQQSNKLMRYTKLFALMGITWIFEVLSWAVEGPDWFWYLTDAINAFRGVFIFVICCCRKKYFVILFNQIFKKSKNGRNQTLKKGTRSVRDRSTDTATDTGCSSYQMIPLQNGTKRFDPEAVDSN